MSSSDSCHPTPPTRSSPTPVDLRHMSSNTVLFPQHKDLPKDHKHPTRSPQHVQTSGPRLGSPTSIPSSPSSVPPPPPPNPHRIPRSKTTEQLEQAVPSVLDSAAEILASMQDEGDHVAVVAPASSLGRSSGFASPIGSFRSRSPSPLGSIQGGANPAGLLLNIPYPNQHPQPATAVSPSVHVSTPLPGSSYQQQGLTSPLSGGLTARPFIQTNLPTGPTSGPAGSTPPSLVTPTSAYFSTASSMESSPTTTTCEHPPQPFPPISPSSSSALSPSAALPPSPNPAQKRLSFMSYTDLLSSTPASTLPLSSLTTSATTAEPPAHIPSVSGLAQAHAQAGSAAASVRNFGVVRDRDSIAMLDDVGGEWEREGLGMGLEERLDAILPVARA